MQPTRAYLDHNATTPLRPAALDAMRAASVRPGNPSSIHAEGRAARAIVEAARTEIGALLGAPARAIVFTSGGTEALNLALAPDLAIAGATPAFGRLLVGAGEHPAVLAGHRFPAASVETVPLTAGGALDLAALERALAGAPDQRPLLALQAANNETGVVQPVAEAARLVHAAGGALVCDAVQAAGKIDCDITRLGADALAVSAHKFGGPQGAGALVFADPASHVGAAMIRGGGQERGARAGTENVAAIAAMAAALGAAIGELEQSHARLCDWRDGLESDISRIAADAIVFGASEPRLPNTSCFAVPGVEAQLLLMFLDIEGVAVSSGSACSSGKVKRSHVLMAMGAAPDLVSCAIRVSLGWDSSVEDCARFARALEKAVGVNRRKPRGAIEAA